MQLSAAEKILIQQFFNSKPVMKAYQSGSYAANQSFNDGGLDILLELDYSRPIGKKFLSWHTELEAVLQKRVRLVATDGISPNIKSIIDSDKILIYEK